MEVMPPMPSDTDYLIMIWPIWVVLCICIIFLAAMLIRRYFLGGREAEAAAWEAERQRVLKEIAAEEQACKDVIAQVESHYGFSAGNVLWSPMLTEVMIVDTNAEHLAIAVKDADELRMSHWCRSEIVSTEVIYDIQQQVSTFGAMMPVMGVPVLAANTRSQEEFKGAYIKILVRDVQNPWVVVPVWSLAEATKWEGILALMVRQAA
jgi:hypothetical protein